MQKHAAIIDYGMGNLRSVQKAIEAVGHSAEIVADPERLSHFSHVILPGVGAFRDAIAHLKETGLAQAFVDSVRSGRQCLGVCLGLQLLFDRSFEDGEHQGLGLIPGEVVRFVAHDGLKIPHMGWNDLRFTREDPLFAGLGPAPYVYFVHSYHGVPAEASDILATSDYAGTFTAAVGRDNLRACQFHPEKSQTVGLRIYANFMSLN